MGDDGDHRWWLLPVEGVVFAAFGQFIHLFAAIPPWVGGGLSALLVGVLLRLLDPSLRRIGERIAARRSSPPPPPSVSP